jgi:SAM-dependent methyltransferase
MAEYNDVYRRAHYYDIVFRRDVSREVQFLQDEYRERHGRPPTAILDIACGPGYHAREAARRGMTAYGIDLRPEMITYAREQATADGVNVTWIAGDMRKFALPKPVDVALSSFDAMDCMLSNDEIVAHFGAIAQNLSPRGLYVVESTHPRDCPIDGYGDFHYRGARNGTRVEIDWATNKPVPNPLTQVIDVEVTMRVAHDGAEETFTDHARERLLLAQEFVALAKLSNALDVVAFYGDFARGQPFDMSAAARRMIVVMQKNSQRPQ